MINIEGLTSKKKGDIALGSAIAYFVSHQYTVAIPLTDSQSYDLVVEKEGTFNRVQIKFTSRKNQWGQYEASLVSTGWKWNDGKNFKNFDNTESDLLFIQTVEGSCYLIPSSLVTVKSGIVISSQKYEQYKVVV